MTSLQRSAVTAWALSANPTGKLSLAIKHMAGVQSDAHSVTGRPNCPIGCYMTTVERIQDRLAFKRYGNSEVVMIPSVVAVIQAELCPVEKPSPTRAVVPLSAHRMQRGNDKSAPEYGCGNGCG